LSQEQLDFQAKLFVYILNNHTLFEHRYKGQVPTENQNFYQSLEKTI
jgi:hypothetical protein